MQKPSLARMVLVLVDPAQNNGSDVAPAVITRVWSENAHGGWTVNLKVHTDGPTDLWLTSWSLHETEEQARAVESTSAVAWWPPRV